MIDNDKPRDPPQEGGMYQKERAVIHYGGNDKPGGDSVEREIQSHTPHCYAGNNDATTTTRDV